MENLDNRKNLLIRELLHKEEIYIHQKICVQKIKDICQEICNTDGVNEREYSRAEKMIAICNSMGV